MIGESADSEERVKTEEWSRHAHSSEAFLKAENRGRGRMVPNNPIGERADVEGAGASEPLGQGSPALIAWFMSVNNWIGVSKE